MLAFGPIYAHGAQLKKTFVASCGHHSCVLWRESLLILLSICTVYYQGH